MFAGSHRKPNRKIRFVLCGVLFFATLGTLTSLLLMNPMVTGAQTVKEFTLVVQEKEITLLESPNKTVTVWAYGFEGEEATVPGPVIRVNKGDLVRIHFKNTHNLPHTIHMHNIHDLNMDGNGVTALGQEQLQLPGDEYTYEFVANQAGVTFYHCHTDTRNHIDFGMYGLIIVDDPEVPPVDQEFITVWDEWDLDRDGEYETHTINSKSFPTAATFTAKVGERVRLILGNIGFQVHSPHMHSTVWDVMNPGDFNDVLWTDPNAVVSLVPGEVKVLEFTPQKPGTWLFHCHFVTHVEDNGVYPRGMLAVVTIEE